MNAKDETKPVLPVSRRIAIPTHCGSIFFEDDTGRAGLERLAAVMGTETSPEQTPGISAASIFARGCFSPGADDVALCRKKEYSVFWQSGEKKIVVALDEKEASRFTHDDFVSLWQWCIAGLSLASLARDSGIVSVHGALLETPRGGLLFCGESGIGKTTLSRRWRESGGGGYADDLVLLDCATLDAPVARSLPTWSRCRENPEDAGFPVTRELPIAGVFALGRAQKNEKENLAAFPGSYFKAQLFRSLFFPVLSAVRRFPESGQILLRDAIWKIAGSLAERFAPRVLNAALDGDLKTTLKEYL